MKINDEIELIDSSEYEESVDNAFGHLPSIARPLAQLAKSSFSKIEKLLLTEPALVELVHNNMPDFAVQAILTDEQKAQLAKGTLRLMTKKDGTLTANLVNPKTGKIVSTVSLQKIKLTPDLMQAVTNYSTQMQLAQISEQIEYIQTAVEEIHQGQEYDRLATAYSCQQKMLQAVSLKDKKLRNIALLQVAQYAEDSRNLLMLSQKNNVKFIAEQPESFWGKLLSGDKPKKINERMNEIRESLCAVNMVSFVEAIAYQEMNEPETAKLCLEYYGDFIKKTFIDVPKLLERLDLIDESPRNYWSTALPDIQTRIQTLPTLRCVAELGE